MPDSPPVEGSLPNRWQAWSFFLKTRIFQARRHLAELSSRPPLQILERSFSNAPIAAELRAPLWAQSSPEEFPLTAGKVENLRVAARALNGLEIPANSVFSFWRQLGRTTRGKGFTTGRELREGCLIPSLGGGLCQISGLIYQAALKAQLEIVERHAHSRVVPGSAAEQDLDATVFWNYVDLRLRAPFPWRIEVQLDATDLIVRIRTVSPQGVKLPAPPLPSPPRAAASGDCLTCNQTSCFRHPSANAAHAPGLGHSAFLLDSRWPEFDSWCSSHSRDNDRWFLPLNAVRWRKPNYAWSPPPSAKTIHATPVTLRRAFRQRRLPSQGAVRQRALIESDAALAGFYAHRISPECRHLVVSMNLLPHIWRSGALGGRTFDVLVERWPLKKLEGILDEAKASNPHSPTLADFRADPQLLYEESEALAAAGRLITPHRAIADHFGERAWLLDWHLPKAKARTPPPNSRTRLFLPCSPLGRKGIYELSDALQGIDAELLILGSAREDSTSDPLDRLDWRPATLSELPSSTALVLPAWIEHQPRIALQALAIGIPVIATTACGLPEHPLLHLIDKPDASAISSAIISLTSPPSSSQPPASELICG